jgi:hypothetical protein
MGLLNCIKLQSSSRRNQESFLRGAFEQQALASADSGLQSDWGIALNDVSAKIRPCGLFSRAEEEMKLSDYEIEETFT